MIPDAHYSEPAKPPLAELARLYAVQTGYRDTLGVWRESPAESIVRVLRALGAEVHMEDGTPETERHLRAATRARKAELGARIIEPVLVAWDGVLRPPVIDAPLDGRNDIEAVLSLEGGGEKEWRWTGRTGGRAPAGSDRLPIGYHRLRIRTGKSEAEATVISAPRRCWAPRPPEGCQWGMFAPLYALGSERDWGAGDLAELGALRDHVGVAGGSAVATLPLLAAFLDRPFDPSPYRPVSRLFWNEFYLAVDQVPEWGSCAAATALWSSPGTRERVARLRVEPLVDYRAVAALKRSVLEELSRCFFERADRGRAERFAAFLRAHPEAERYAAFRAQIEGVGVSEGAEGGDSDSQRYHLYCQWQIEEQLGRLAGHPAGVEGAPDLEHAPPGLLLDLPVGVHPDGFDTWRWPELFASGVSMGAPPDSFFASGQNWESPPLHPERAREDGHQYFARCIRHHMRHARYLRVDHVMSLHRLFWVPEGKEPTDGVYVTYPQEELYAVLCLESHRHQTVVVGEDLGTVPPGVRTSMRRRGLLGTWVLQSSLRPRAAEPIGSVPRHAVVSLGTHDMFPFAGFLRGEDIRARVETGQLDEARARRASAARRRLVAKLAARVAPTASLAPGAEPDEAAILKGVLGYLARSEAPLAVVNLEDLLLETKPQNLPGTGTDWENWRRKIARSEEKVGQVVEEAGRWLCAIQCDPRCGLSAGNLALTNGKRD